MEIFKNETSEIKPFKINISTAVLDDLRERLKKTRWPSEIKNPSWKAGTNPDYLREICDYWLNEFDWSKQEQLLNRFSHFKSEGIHFIHERGQGPNPFPLLLTHGFPDSFVRFTKIIPMLTNPEAYGGRAEDSFDVVVPDLSGYGFSDKPDQLGNSSHIGDMWASLMSKLGYEKFGAHGGDWGSSITEQLANQHSSHVVGIHLTDVPFSHIFEKPSDLSAKEKKFFAKNEEWMKTEGAYAQIQSTKPLSLAPALNDSPVGLAAWILDKFQAWSDCHGDIETRFTKDELLTNITVYWATQTIETSFLTYFDYGNGGALTWIKEGLRSLPGKSKVPTGFAIFPADISQPPREWAERFFDVVRWTEMDRGGHFAALEEPELLVQDIREMFRPLRTKQ